MNSQMSKMFAALALTAGIGSVFASGDADAISRPRAFDQNATGGCQSALPVFDGQIRKRPLAIQNEGTAPAFVSCSFMTPIINTGVSRVNLYADNNTGATLDITCTLVVGLSNFDMPTYLPKTISVPANSGLYVFEWTSVDNGGVNFNSYAISASCNLPVGTGLSLSQIIYDEDVGA
ncbi:MAG: hypothetical protein ABIP11_08655 [Luteimonas sp.]